MRELVNKGADVHVRGQASHRLFSCAFTVSAMCDMMYNSPNIWTSEVYLSVFTVCHSQNPTVHTETNLLKKRSMFSIVRGILSGKIKPISAKTVVCICHNYKPLQIC